MVRRRVGTGAFVAGALFVWALLLVVAVVWGRSLLPGGLLNAPAPPFEGTYRLALSGVVPALVFATALIVVLPRLAATLPWRPLLTISWLLAAAWAVVLNAWDGHPGLGSVLAGRHEYLAVLPVLDDHPVAWLRGFTDHIRDYPVHVEGHPPLMVLVFWLLEHVGLGGRNWAAALVIGVGASSVVAVAVTVRVVSDEAGARRLLPFLVLAPFAITVATSADSFFTGVGAWSVAALALGVRKMSPGWLAAGGLLAGALPYLNYGLLAFGTIPLTAALLAWRVRRPRVTPLAIAALVAGLLLLPVLMTLGGFWWPHGVEATHGAWVAGHGNNRPYAYSFVADLAVLAVLVGPATAAGAASRLREPAMALGFASLLAVLVLDVSGVTRLEVERIWLPYAPWLMVVCSALRRGQRGWLAANALCALAFQALVMDVW